MKKLEHEKLLDSFDNFVNTFEKLGPQVFNDSSHINKNEINQFISYFNHGRMLNIYNNLIDAQIYFWKEYKQNKNVYIIERDLSIAIANSSLKIDVEDLTFPYDSFIVYPNLTYSDLGFSEFEDIVIPVCVHFKITRKNTGYLFDWVLLIYDNSDGENSKILGNYKLSEYGKMELSFGQTYKKENIYDQTINESNKTLSCSKSFEKFKQYGNYEKAHYVMRDKLINLIFCMMAYLEMHKDEEIIKPKWTRSKIEIIRNPKKKRKAEKEYAESAKYDIRHIGKKYAYNFRKQFHNNKQKYQIEVPGHFNYYWYGTRKDEFGNKRKGEYKKALWLQPQIKLSHLPKKGNTKIYKVK